LTAQNLLKLHMTNKRKQSGFTLIELMIVIAIIGILASIAIPQFSSMRVKAFNAAALSDLKMGKMILENFYDDYFTYPDTHALFTGTGIITLNQGGDSISFQVSKGISLLYNKGAIGSGHCMVTKHKLGNRIYMVSNVVYAPTPLSALAAENVVLQSVGANPVVADCSGMDSSQIKAIGIS